MALPRIIVSLLLKDGGLVKTTKFNNPNYIGDPINAVKIFNEKSCDELMIADLLASPLGREPDYDLIADIVSEAFMPVSYIGGIRNLEQMKRILQLGVEKIGLNSAAHDNPSIIKKAAETYGSQSVVVVIDFKKDIWGRTFVVSHSAKRKHKVDLVNWAVQMQDLGAGELVINSVDRDGTFLGYDLESLSKVSSAVEIPVVALGGAKDFADIANVLKSGIASAAAAGALFVYQGPHKAVLLSYPSFEEAQAALKQS